MEDLVIEEYKNYGLVGKDAGLCGTVSERWNHQKT